MGYGFETKLNVLLHYPAETISSSIRAVFSNLTVLFVGSEFGLDMSYVLVVQGQLLVNGLCLHVLIAGVCCVLGLI